MIYTLTVNPSLDYTVYLDAFTEGELNRTDEVAYLPGGKGINVSQILQAMQIDNIALGFVGGFTGDFLRKNLQEHNIQTDFVMIDEPTRINVKIKASKESEINAAGPAITDTQVNNLLEKVATLTEKDYIVLSGSVPANIASQLYERVAKTATAQGATIIVDAEKTLVEQTLPYKPLFIKPNEHELGEMFGVTIRNPQQAIPYAQKLLEQGAQSVIVSFGGAGALYVATDHIYYAPAPEGTVKNTVGAGDSVVAGFLGKLIRTGQVEEAFRYSVAAGSATAFSAQLATAEEIEIVSRRIQIEDWSDKK